MFLFWLSIQNQLSIKRYVSNKTNRFYQSLLMNNFSSVLKTLAKKAFYIRWVYKIYAYFMRNGHFSMVVVGSSYFDCSTDKTFLEDFYL